MGTWRVHSLFSDLCLQCVQGWGIKSGSYAQSCMFLGDFVKVMFAYFCWFFEIAVTRSDIKNNKCVDLDGSSAGLPDSLDVFGTDVVSYNSWLAR